MKFTVADLFSGAGGLSLGFRNAGFDVVFSADNDSDSLQTYSTNFNCEAEQLDLAMAPAGKVAKHIRRRSGHIDVLAGGPPCQGFSTQRRGPDDDPRNHLVLRHVEIGLALDARVIVIENVPTIFGPRGKKQLTEALTALKRAEYRVSTDILQAADFGVPQLRRRAFVVAYKEKMDGSFSFEKPCVSPSDYVTVREALRGLPDAPNDYQPHPTVPNHQHRRISAENVKRLSYVPQGGGRLDIPEHLWLPCHKRNSGHRHLDVYGRMSWDKPAPTITAMFDNFTRGRFGHPVENRNITNREGARLQSFPDDFVFLGDQKSVARQIGNAVPPLLAEAVAASIKKNLCGSASLRKKPGKRAA